MPGSRGFLDRFRASGTPGAAAGAGVPADRVAERDAELAGIFSRLEQTETEAARIRADGAERSEKAHATAGERARRMVAAARHDAESERRDAAASIAALTERETRETLEAAERDAAAVRAHAAARTPDLVETVLDQVARRLGVASLQVEPTAETMVGPEAP
jgi:vacuolar-type H+-ATPase subunit H